MGTHKASEDQQPTGEDTEDKDYKDLKGDSILESVENGDGSVDVILSDDKEAPAAKTGFYDNIASNLPADRLSRLSLDLADLMDRDQTARENRDKDQADRKSVV